MTDSLAEDLSELRRMQEEQDARIGDNLAAIEEERRVAEELLQSKAEDVVTAVGSDNQGESSVQDRKTDQEILNENGSTNSIGGILAKVSVFVLMAPHSLLIIDLRKSIILRPPTIYRGDLTSQRLHEHEWQGDDKTQASFKDGERNDVGQEHAVGQLNGSSLKVV